MCHNHQPSNNSSSPKSILVEEWWAEDLIPQQKHYLPHVSKQKMHLQFQLYYFDPPEWNTAAPYSSWSAIWANELRGTTEHDWEIEAAAKSCVT